MPAQLPDRHEAGTANVPGIAGLLAGLQYIRNTGVETILRHECQMREQAARLCSRFDRLRIFTGSPGTQTGVLSLVCAGMDTEDLAQCLAARKRSASAPGFTARPWPTGRPGPLRRGRSA